MLIKKNHYPKASNNVVVRYVERTKLRDQGYPLMEAIVALANTDGGRVYIGRKSKTNGGVPIDLQQEYRKYDYGVGKIYTEERWSSVVPDTIGEEKYYTMCNMR